jgi:hydroxymethylpyrimidine/phosphomethylpyrimidine kinase
MSASRIPNVLSIAGSDPSGGAGIQADLKTFSALGCYGMAALTALTAQNTQGVTAIHVPPPEFLSAQIAAIAADIHVDAIKIGMIANAAVAEAAAASLSQLKGARIVLDPVMVAKGGHPLLEPDAVAVVRDRLVPLADVITPNLEEAAALLAEPRVTSRADMPAQALRLMALGAGAVLLKGGHLEGADSPDYLLTATGGVWLEGERIATTATHGTGCTLSSAIAARLAHGETLAEACHRAKAYVTGAIAAAGRLAVGQGHAPTHHFHSWF